MITQKQQKQGVELMKMLVEEAWKNATFKDQLIIDPVQTIQNFTGNAINLPSNKKLIVEDQTNENIIYINIPSKPDFSNIELSDEQLEAVSGGEIGLTGWIIISAVVLIAGGGVGYGLGQAVK